MLYFLLQFVWLFLPFIIFPFNCPQFNWLIPQIIYVLFVTQIHMTLILFARIPPLILTFLFEIMFQLIPYKSEHSSLFIRSYVSMIQIHIILYMSEHRFLFILNSMSESVIPIHFIQYMSESHYLFILNSVSMIRLHLILSMSELLSLFIQNSVSVFHILFDQYLFEHQYQCILK